MRVSLNFDMESIFTQCVASVLPKVDLRDLGGKKIFITGGTGFFGIWLLSTLKLLNTTGIPVNACVLSRNSNAFLARYPYFNHQSWLTFVEGNIRDFHYPDQAFHFLLHAATETSASAHAHPDRILDDIVIGTRHVLNFAKTCGVHRILLVSSGAVYGPQPSTITHQPDDSPLACNPLLHGSAYGEGKRVMELMGALLNQQTGTEFISARCFAFCGPALPIDGHFAIGNFIRDALFQDHIRIEGDGTPMRSYLDGSDLALWLLLLLVKGQSGLSYNVGSDEALSILEIAHRVRDLLAPEKPIKIMKLRDPKSTVRHQYVPSIERARALGCQPWTSLDESITMTGEYWRKVYLNR